MATGRKRGSEPIGDLAEAALKGHLDDRIEKMLEQWRDRLVTADAQTLLGDRRFKTALRDLVARRLRRVRTEIESEVRTSLIVDPRFQSSAREWMAGELTRRARDAEAADRARLDAVINQLQTELSRHVEQARLAAETERAVAIEGAERLRTSASKALEKTRTAADEIERSVEGKIARVNGFRIELDDKIENLKGVTEGRLDAVRAKAEDLIKRVDDKTEDRLKGIERKTAQATENATSNFRFLTAAFGLITSLLAFIGGKAWFDGSKLSEALADVQEIRAGLSEDRRQIMDAAHASADARISSALATIQGEQDEARELMLAAYGELKDYSADAKGAAEVAGAHAGTADGVRRLVEAKLDDWRREAYRELEDELKSSRDASEATLEQARYITKSTGATLETLRAELRRLREEMRLARTQTLVVRSSGPTHTTIHDASLAEPSAVALRRLRRHGEGERIQVELWADAERPTTSMTIELTAGQRRPIEGTEHELVLLDVHDALLGPDFVLIQLVPKSLPRVNGVAD